MPECGLVGADSLRRAVDRVEMHARADVRGVPAVPDVHGDRLVAEVGDVVRLPVMLHAFGDRAVEQAVECRQRHGLDILRLHLGDVPERLQYLLGLFMRTVPADDQNAEQITDAVGGDERQLRRDLPAEEAPELLGRLHDVFAESLQHGRGIVELVEHRSAHDVAGFVEPKLEAGDDAEVATSTAQRPIQILVLRRVGGDLPAVGENDIGRKQIVDGESAATGQVTETAAERQAADAGGRDDPGGYGETERVGRVVDVAPGRAASHPGDLVPRIDSYVVDRGQVDHEAVVHGAESGHAVSPAPNRQVEAVLAAGRDRCHDVGRVRAPHHGNRSPVVHPVVNGASLVVVGI